MMQDFLHPRTLVSVLATPTGSGGPVVLTSTGDKYIVTPAAPLMILKWGLVLSTSLSTGGNGLVCNLDKRPTAGSDTNRTTLDTLSVGTSNTTFVAGLGIYRDPFTASSTATTPASEVANAGPLGNTANTITSGQQALTIIPGQELVMKVATAASTTGQGYFWLEYIQLPISKPSGYGTTQAGTVSLTENYTRVAS